MGALRGPAAAAAALTPTPIHFFPLIYPPTLVHVVSCAKWFRGRRINPDKVICMGKISNRLAATKPISRLAHVEGTRSWEPDLPYTRKPPTLHKKPDLPYSQTPWRSATVGDPL
jgi:hypothetical protein